MTYNLNHLHPSSASVSSSQSSTKRSVLDPPGTTLAAAPPVLCQSDDSTIVSVRSVHFGGVTVSRCGDSRSNSSSYQTLEEYECETSKQHGQLRRAKQSLDDYLQKLQSTNPNSKLLQSLQRLEEEEPRLQHASSECSSSTTSSSSSSSSSDYRSAVQDDDASSAPQSETLSWVTAPQSETLSWVTAPQSEAAQPVSNNHETIIAPSSGGGGWRDALWCLPETTARNRKYTHGKRRMRGLFSSLRRRPEESIASSPDTTTAASSSTDDEKDGLLVSSSSSSADWFSCWRHRYTAAVVVHDISQSSSLVICHGSHPAPPCGTLPFEHFDVDLDVSFSRERLEV